MAERYMAGEVIAEEDWKILDGIEQQDILFGDFDLNVFWGRKGLSNED